ncbi:MAG: hypothetical protein GW778_00510 [Alphaproteobacteria bacterium]|nr:hypothetical protein [Alphaproteobacteria bacterium]
MSTLQTINFKDSKAAINKPEFYIPVVLDINAILKSWQLSIFSFEWINKDASIKDISALKEADQEKRKAIEAALTNNEPLEKPILGIGIQDNVEIGSGKAVICTLAAHGVKTIPAHIPKSNESDFKDLIADEAQK